MPSKNYALPMSACREFLATLKASTKRMWRRRLRPQRFIISVNEPYFADFLNDKWIPL